MIKTVYFIGAGASRGSDFRLPTMEGFFEESRFVDNNFPNLEKYINTLYPNMPFEKITLEDLITHLKLISYRIKF